MFLFLMRISWYLISLSQHFICNLINLPSTLPPLGRQTFFFFFSLNPDFRAACVRGICSILRVTCGRESWLSGTTVLTAFDLQGAVLLIKRVAAQVHHAGCGCGDPTHTQSGMEIIRFNKKTMLWARARPVHLIWPSRQRFTHRSRLGSTWYGTMKTACQI